MDSKSNINKSDVIAITENLRDLNTITKQLNEEFMAKNKLLKDAIKECKECDKALK
jgi:hypothetical protein